MIDIDKIQKQTQQWFEQVVLGLNLCPFAHVPAKEGRVRFCVLEVPDERGLLMLLERELNRLRCVPATELETTIIIAPKGFDDFFYYMTVIEYLAQWLAQEGWEGEVQIASFHPEYQFAHTQPGDRENLTNCSPYPLFHLIREASLTRVIDQGADTAAIPERNIATIEALPQQECLKLFPYVEALLCKR
ncbi:DUF1415 domain-containing protein [Marinagarivorans algicola]|uniref:DUF1415 domain-containing protein n=1 Tax=Marinagarivorans algicola TaxID=1513270 RepID=UPI0006B5BFF9|nr:DUF1415 domain-containing protein [Marinagarivorans algicola]